MHKQYKNSLSHTTFNMITKNFADFFEANSFSKLNTDQMHIYINI